MTQAAPQRRILAAENWFDMAATSY